MNGINGRIALGGVALAFALALGACQDADAVAKADAAAKARAAEARKAESLKGKVTHQVDCLSALRWQQAALASAGIGDLNLYEDHYRTRLDDAVGSTVIAGENGVPTLSRATMQDYLYWAYQDTVAHKFTAGIDANKDGTLSPKEKNGRGYNMVAACVLEVAEAGKGPLAGPDKVDRMFKIQALAAKLKDKGA